MSPDAQPGFSPPAQVAVSSPTRLAALLLCEQKPHTPRELGEALGMSRQVMQSHVNKLLAVGLLEEAGRSTTRGGTTVSYVAVRPGWAEAIAAVNALTNQTRSWRVTATD